MRILKCTILLMITVFIPVSAETRELSLKEAVDLSLENSLSLRSRNLELGIKERSRDMSWNAFIPSMTASSSLSRTNEAPSYGDHNWALQLKFDAQLNINLALFDGIRHTRLDYESGLLDRASAEAQIALAVKNFYYNILLFEEQIEVQKQFISSSEKHLEQTERNFEAGLASQFQVLSARIAVENQKPELENMKMAYHTVMLQFKQLLALGRDTDVVLTDSIKVTPIPLNHEDLLEEALENRFDLMALRKTVQIKKNANTAEKNLAYTPMLTLMYSYDPTFTGNPFKDELFSDFDNDWMQVSGMFGVFLTFNLDTLLPFSSTQVKIQNSADSLASLETSLALAVQGAEVEIDSLLYSLEKSSSSLNALDLNEMLAEKAYQMAEQGYETGAQDYLELLDAENNLRKARLYVLSEKFNYVTTLFQLEYAANKNITEDFLK